MNQNIEQPSRLERRKERLRLHIIQVATELYDQNGGEEGGFENTTIESIAEKSDISLRTFFRYFESKQDVIYLDCRRAVEDMENHVRPLLESLPPENAALTGCIDQMRSFIAVPVNRARLVRALKSPNFTDRRAVWQHMAQASLQELLVPHLADRANPALSASAIALVVRGAINLGFEDWASDPRKDPEPFMREALEEMRQSVGRLTLDQK